MKKQFLFLLLSISFFSFSQEIKRENVNGKIIVEGDDIEGITIYNSSSTIGTVTNEKGEFTIPVGLNDLLEIRAVEYQKFDVTVNKLMLESKKISVFLIDQNNILDEVVINNKKLTGNLNLDLKKVKTFKEKVNTIYFAKESMEPKTLVDDNRSQIKNLAPHPTLVYGLNIINVVDQLLIPLFRSEVQDKKAIGIPEVPVKSIKYYLGSVFLIENFNIPEHRVEEFIRYIEDETFDFDLLNYGHEMEFLELLNKKSKTFLKTKSITD